jgi:DNA gyrase subunit A
VRAVGRTAQGVKGVTLGHDKDEVIGMICIADQESNVLVVSKQGYGKRSAVEDYRITNRGGKGVKTINVTEKTGELIAILNVTDDMDLMIINKSGLTIRMSIDELRVMGRATQGVRLINLKGKDEIAAVAKVIKEDEDEVLYDEEGNVIDIVVEEDGAEKATEDNSEESSTDAPEENSGEEEDDKE